MSQITCLENTHRKLTMNRKLNILKKREKVKKVVHQGSIEVSDCLNSENPIAFIDYVGFYWIFLDPRFMLYQLNFTNILQPKYVMHLSHLFVVFWSFLVYFWDLNV